MLRKDNLHIPYGNQSSQFGVLRIPEGMGPFP